MIPPQPFRAVVVGCSAGGLEALRQLLGPLPATFALPIIVVAHTSTEGPSMLACLLDRVTALPVVEAEDKMPVEAGRVHIAPSGYHLLIENDETFSLSVDDKVCNSRPSIDVLFESAADVWSDRLIGVVLTGANNDGTNGLKTIKTGGGYAIVEDPETAFAKAMPASAIAGVAADCVLPLAAIADHLTQLSMDDGRSRR
ncbi:chemotaxis protein CheB [Telmatospirillum sp.]|uniref:chemotaxis protein CheB n=1 Tax=Telmatospirillum sp. TaxID=2079197 RepID=UPI00283E5A35|nr:chemotaxis protein CheB [Telmatospirillum sp.]MDR3440921.1 chemotaxis protein CheB [Telmatospirillum sp.]